MSGYLIVRAAGFQGGWVSRQLGVRSTGCQGILGFSGKVGVVKAAGCQGSWVSGNLGVTADEYQG